MPWLLLLFGHWLLLLVGSGKFECQVPGRPPEKVESSPLRT